MSLTYIKSSGNLVFQVEKIRRVDERFDRNCIRINLTYEPCFSDFFLDFFFFFGFEVALLISRSTDDTAA